MSKTMRQNNRNNSGWLTVSLILALAGGLLINGRIPLDPYFYLCTLAAGIAVYIAGKAFLFFIDRHRLAGASMQAIDRMTGEEFERYLGILYERAGYRVEYTPGTMDFGADLILTKKKLRIAVQAKRYRNQVGEAAVQQALSGMGYYKADLCMVVTNSEFTYAARELAKKTKVILIGRKQLGTSAMYPQNIH